MKNLFSIIHGLIAASALASSGFNVTLRTLSRIDPIPVVAGRQLPRVLPSRRELLIFLLILAAAEGVIAYRRRRRTLEVQS